MSLFLDPGSVEGHRLSFSRTVLQALHALAYYMHKAVV